MNKENFQLQAVVENLGQVLLAVDRQLEAVGCPLKIQMQIDIAVEELFVNIAHYAYAPEIGDAEIIIETMETCPLPDERRKDMTPEELEGLWAKVTLSDSGRPFNPLAAEDPDISLPAHKRRIGGLGIFMVKKSMDHMFYEYKDGKNNISICKKLR